MTGADRHSSTGDGRGGAQRFERTVLAHLDSAYNLASWLLRNRDDAAEVVQEACLKAWRAFDGFKGGDPRAWLLAIVRTSAYNRVRSRGASVVAHEADERPAAGAGLDAALVRSVDGALVNRALAALAEAHREILVLRDVEGLTYEQIARVIDAPVGTVMSRVSRARDALERSLSALMPKEHER